VSGDVVDPSVATIPEPHPMMIVATLRMPPQLARNTEAPLNISAEQSRNQENTCGETCRYIFRFSQELPRCRALASGRKFSSSYALAGATLFSVIVPPPSPAWQIPQGPQPNGFAHLGRVEGGRGCEWQKTTSRRGKAVSAGAF
jgi:hypothetical protein